MAFSGIVAPSIRSVPFAPARQAVSGSVAAPQAEPGDSFQPSSPQVTGSWLSGQLKNAKPGALFVLDDFQPTGGQAIPGPFAAAEWMASHGGNVVSTAHQEGHKGATLPLEINRPLTDDQRQQKYGEMTRLWNQGTTPEELRKSLYERAVVNRTRLLENAATSLDDLAQSGAKNSVVNISASGSQAATVNNLLQRLVPKDPNDPESVTAARAERAKYATALGVSDADLSSQNLEVQGAARQKLFQGVVDLVASTQKDPRFVEAKSNYTESVNRFEAGHNSVVVSAGNDGTVESYWENVAHQKPLNVGAEFAQNDLGVEAATVVGATRDWEGTHYPAEYNNRYAGVDMYANGYAGDATKKANEGSSFAAPRVATAMAAIHAQFPGLSSSQAENLLRQQLTGRLPDFYDSPVLPVLDEQRTSQFLQQGKF